MPQSRSRSRSLPTLPESQKLPRRPAAWPRESAELQAAAEAMLHEMAFVFQATRSVRQALDIPARPARTSPAAGPLA